MTLTLEQLQPGHYGYRAARFAGLGQCADDDLACQLNELSQTNAMLQAGPSATGSLEQVESSGTINTYYDANGNLIIPGGIGGTLVGSGYTSISPSGVATDVSGNLPATAPASTTASGATGIIYTGSVYGSGLYSGTQAQNTALAQLTGQSAAQPASTGISSNTLLIAAAAIFGLLLIMEMR